MDLLDLRQAFVRRSGRYDLVVDPNGAAPDWTDNGANYYLNLAIKWLDKKQLAPQSERRVYKAIESGDVGVSLTRCRAIKEVWVANADGRAPVERISFQEMRSAYWKVTADTVVNAPAVYTPARMRADVSELTVDQLAVLATWADLYDDDLTTDSGVLFYPPADGDYILEVFGLFRQAELSDDDDVNYWSIDEPEAVILAAMYWLEVSYRNTEGAKDWLAAIDEYLTGVDKDLVEALGDIDAMGG